MRVLQATTLTILLLGACATVSAQNNGRLPGSAPGVPPQNQTPPFGSAPGNDNNPIAAEIQHRMTITRANERQKKMVADTDQLLALANELKAEMDKTNSITLSVQVIKKADEIEKLAHDIKQRMKE